jgi:hypothetical protein
MIRWPWSKKTPEPKIQPFTVPHFDNQPDAPKVDGIEVEEVDTSNITETGIHRLWKGLIPKD